MVMKVWIVYLVAILGVYLPALTFGNGQEDSPPADGLEESPTEAPIEEAPKEEEAPTVAPAVDVPEAPTEAPKEEAPKEEEAPTAAPAVDVPDSPTEAPKEVEEPTTAPAVMITEPPTEAEHVSKAVTTALQRTVGDAATATPPLVQAALDSMQRPDYVANKQNNTVLLRIPRRNLTPESLKKLKRLIARRLKQAAATRTGTATATAKTNEETKDTVTFSFVSRRRRREESPVTTAGDGDGEDEDDSVEFVLMTDGDDDSVVIAILAGNNAQLLTTQELEPVIVDLKDEIEQEFGNIEINPKPRTAADTQPPEITSIQTVWTRHYGLFLTIIILVAICIVITIVCCLCLRCRTTEDNEKTPMSMEEGRCIQPVSVSNPISDAEIVRDEAPMQECANPSLPINGGGGQHISKYDDDNGWVVPLEELSGLENSSPDIENTRL